MERINCLINDMTTSDYAAWWGAIVATIVVIFEFYKWVISGPKLKLNIQSNMKIWSEHDVESKETYINISVINRGDTLTTLESLLVFSYDGFLNYLFFRKRAEAFFINPVPPSNELPYELLVGKRWKAMINQKIFSKLSKLYYLRIALYYSHNDKPLYKSFKITESSTKL